MSVFQDRQRKMDHRQQFFCRTLPHRYPPPVARSTSPTHGISSPSQTDLYSLAALVCHAAKLIGRIPYDGQAPRLIHLSLWGWASPSNLFGWNSSGNTDGPSYETTTTALRRSPEKLRVETREPGRTNPCVAKHVPYSSTDPRYEFADGFWYVAIAPVVEASSA